MKDYADRRAAVPRAEGGRATASRARSTSTSRRSPRSTKRYDEAIERYAAVARRRARLAREAAHRRDVRQAEARRRGPPLVRRAARGDDRPAHPGAPGRGAMLREAGDDRRRLRGADEGARRVSRSRPTSCTTRRWSPSGSTASTRPRSELAQARRAEARRRAGAERARLHARRPHDRARRKATTLIERAHQARRRTTRSSSTAWGGRCSGSGASTTRRRTCAARSPSGPTPRSPRTWAKCCGRRATARCARAIWQSQLDSNPDNAVLKETVRGSRLDAPARRGAARSRATACATRRARRADRRRERRGRVAGAVRRRRPAVRAPRQRRRRAHFDWQHDAARDRIALATPLGQTLARLTGDPPTACAPSGPTGAASSARDWDDADRRACSACRCRCRASPRGCAASRAAARRAASSAMRAAAPRVLAPGRLGDRLRVRRRRRAARRRASRCAYAGRADRGAHRRRPLATERAPTRLAVPAPAKVNLFLHVTGRRADGYHRSSRCSR